jgi:small subunit ribosomal protein S6
MKESDLLREYEITVLINSQLPEEEIKKLHKKYEGVLLQDGGEVIKKSHWGNKKLAFPIKKHFRGNFVHYDLTTLSGHLAEAERLMRIDENVLRYMSVRIGENVDPNERKAQLAKLEARAARSEM